jgi:hypothetical protein
MEFNDYEIISICEKFLSNFGLDKELQGICALTVVEDRSSLSGSFIFNYNTKTIEKQYPEFLKKSHTPIYVSHNGFPFTINFKTDLPLISENGELSCHHAKGQKILKLMKDHS